MAHPLLENVIHDCGRLSYGVIAEKWGLTRNQVAGMVWRHKNPPDVRVNAEGERRGKRNRNGRGYGCGPYPPITLANSR